MRDTIRVACTRNLSAVLTLCHLERLFIIGAATYGVHYSVSMSLKWCGTVWYGIVECMCVWQRVCAGWVGVYNENP